LAPVPTVFESLDRAAGWPGRFEVLRQMNQKPQSRRRQPIPFDLRKENPQGRMDVLAANLLEQFSSRVPELQPVFEKQREVIHATLNEQFGPHVVDLQQVMEAAAPYLPLLEVIAQKVIQKVTEQPKVEVKTPGKADAA
jgi:hypothetical protein